MKKFSGTWILLAIFAALAIVLFVVKPKTSEEVKEESLTLVKLDREKLSKVTVTNATGTFTLEKTDGAWKITAPNTWPVEETSLNQVKNALEGLVASDAVWPEGTPEEREKAGLAKATATVYWKSDDGKEGTLEIGRDLPKNEVYYVAASGKKGIYTARKWNVEVFTKGVTGFRRRKVLGELDRDQVTTIVLEVPGREPLLFSRADAIAPWYVQTPFNGRADRGKANGLLTRLVNLRSEEFVDEGGPPKGVPGHRGTITLAGGGGKTWSVLVGAEKKDGEKTRFWVREGETGQLSLAEGPLPSDLAEPFAAWRDKQLFDFFTDDVTAIDLVLEKGALTLARNDDRMFATTGATPVLVNSEANELLRALRDSTILEVGPDAPAGSAKSRELGLERPVVHARWEAPGWFYEVWVGNAKPGKTQRWVRTSEGPSAVLVDGDPLVKAFTAAAVAASALPTPTPAPTPPG